MTPTLFGENSAVGAHARLVATGHRSPLDRFRGHEFARSVDRPVRELSLAFSEQRSKALLEVHGFCADALSPALLYGTKRASFAAPRQIRFLIQELPATAIGPTSHGWIAGEVVARRGKPRFVIRDAKDFTVEKSAQSLRAAPALWSIALRDIEERCLESGIASVEFAKKTASSIVSKLRPLFDYDGYETVIAKRNRTSTTLPEAWFRFDDNEPQVFTREIHALASGHQLEVVVQKQLRLRVEIIKQVIARISSHLEVFPDVELSVVAFGTSKRDDVASTTNGLIWCNANSLRRYANIDNGNSARRELNVEMDKIIDFHGASKHLVLNLIDHEFGHRLTEHIQSVDPFGYAKLVRASLRRMNVSLKNCGVGQTSYQALSKVVGSYAADTGGAEIDAQLFALSCQRDAPDGALYFHKGLRRLDEQWRVRAPYAFTRLK